MDHRHKCRWTYAYATTHTHLSLCVHAHTHNHSTPYLSRLTSIQIQLYSPKLIVCDICKQHLFSHSGTIYFPDTVTHTIDSVCVCECACIYIRGHSLSSFGFSVGQFLYINEINGNGIPRQDKRQTYDTLQVSYRWSASHMKVPPRTSWCSANLCSSCHKSFTQIWILSLHKEALQSDYALWSAAVWTKLLHCIVSVYSGIQAY